MSPRSPYGAFRWLGRRALGPIAGLAVVLAVAALVLLLDATPAEAQMDTRAPILQSAAINGTTVTLTYDEALDETSVPATSAFFIGVGAVAISPTGVSISGTTVTLTLAAADAPTHGETVTMVYIAPAVNPIRDLSGNRALTFSGQSPTNNTPPAFSSAAFNEATLDIIFDGLLDTGSVPAADAFTVKVGGTTVALAASGAVAVEGTGVRLTLASAVQSDQTVTVSYTAPAANPLRDSDNAMLPVPDFSDQNVSHDASAGGDLTPPTLQSAEVDGDELRLVYDEALTVSQVSTGAFGITVAGSNRRMSRASVRASAPDTVVIVLSSAVSPGQSVTVNYTPTAVAVIFRIRDAAGNEAAAFRGQAVTNNTVDLAPTFESASVNGTALTITFNETLAAAPSLANSSFTVKKTPQGGSEQSVSLAGSPAISGATVTLTLATAVAGTDTGVKVSYTKPTTGSSNKLQDATGNEVASFNDQAVTNDTPHPPPMLESAEVDGTVLRLNFDKAILGTQSGDANPGPSASAFTVSASGGAVTVSSAWFEIAHRNSVRLNLSRAVTAAETVTVSYAAESAGSDLHKIQDRSGTFAASFTDQPVTNNTNQAPRVLEVVGGACRVKTDTTTPRATINSPAGTLVSLGPLSERGSETTEFPSDCAANAPYFDDQDGDALTFSLSYDTPENVRHGAVSAGLQAPAVGRTPPLIFYIGAAAFEDTDFRVDITATDPHGASATTHVVFQIRALQDANFDVHNPLAPYTPNAPSFGTATVADKTYAAGEAITAFTLPEASGGDLFGGAYSHLYAVSGLPAGLSFDAATRTVSGTPAAAGSFTVTYTAEDADANRDAADTASLSFTIEVNDGVPPQFVSGTVDGTVLTLTFDEALSTAHVPAVRQFYFGVVGSPDAASPNRIAISGSTVTLTLPSGSKDVEGVSYYVGYAKDGNSAQNLQDPSGNEVADFTRAVTNETPNLDAPQFESATVDGTVLTLTFDEALSTAHVPAVRQFYFGVVGSPDAASPNRIAISGSTVTLTLPSGSKDVEGVSYYVGYAKDGNSAQNLQDPSGNEVADFTRAVTNETPNLDAPQFESATVDGTVLTLTFDEDLAAAGRLAIASFTVKRTPRGGTEETVRLSGRPAIAGATVTLTLASTVLQTDTGVTVSYAKPATGSNNKLQDDAGNEVSSFTDRPVTNETPPAPNFESATVNGTVLTLIFDKDLAAAGRLANASFTVKRIPRGGTEETVRLSGRPVIDGETVTLTLASFVLQTDIGVTVSYARPATGSNNRLRDDAGREVGSFTDRPVTNETLPAPEFVSAVVYGEVVQVTFSETLGTTAAGRPAVGTFTVMVDGERRYVRSVVIDGVTVRLTLVSRVSSGQPVTVAYARPSRGGKLQNASGIAAPSFGAQAVRYVRPPWPEVYGVEVNGDRVTLTFTQPLDPARRPSASRFTVEQYFRVYTAVPVRRVEIDPAAPRQLVLTLSRSVRTGAAQNIWMHYEGFDDTNALRGLFGQRVQNFRGLKVPNLTPIPRWSETVGLVQVGTSVHDSPCGRYRPSLTWDEIGNGDMYLCDTAQRQWTLVRFAIPGRDYEGMYDMDWILVADRQATTGGCLLYGYDSIRDEWMLTSSPDGFLCDQARQAAREAREGEDAVFRIVIGTPAASGTSKSVAYSTEDDTATAGEDYEATQGTLVFGPGERMKTVRVKTLRDGLSEGPETMRLRLSDARGFMLSEQVSVMTGTILNSDAPPATVTGVAITSDAGDDATYAQDDVIRVAVTFSEAVDVDATGGSPRLKLGMDPGSGEIWAPYESGSGSTTLTFAHTVAEPDVSTQGIAVLENTLELNGGSIRTAAGVDAELSHAGLDHDAGHRVDWAQPPPPTLAVADARGEEGGTLSFVVALSEASGETVTVDYATADGTATAGADYAAASGTLFFVAGETERTVSVPALADADAEGDETLTLTLSNPWGAVIGDGQATGTVSNVAPLPTLTVADARGEEGGTLSFVVALSAASGETVTVDYATADGTATAGADYAAASGTLFFAAGETERTVAVQALADEAAEAAEGDETLTLTLSNPWGAVIGDGQATGTVSNVAPPPILTVADARGEEGGTLSFIVALSAASGETVTVDYATADGTATAGTDYAASSGTLFFAAGETERTVAVQALSDEAAEGDETLTLTLSNPSGAVIGDGQATGTVSNVLPVRVSIAADPANPRTGTATRLEAAILNAPAGRNPAYQWEINWDGTWIAASTERVLNYLVNDPGPVAFRLTVRYGAGVRATSDPITVTWTASQPPVVNEQSANYAAFVNEQNAPRGTLVSKPFHGIFADPEGEELTYTVSILEGQARLVDELAIPTEAYIAQSGRPIEVALRLYFRAETATDWSAITPALPDPLVTTVILTATDPDGLSASLSGVFLTDWASHPELLGANTGGEAIELTFDRALRAAPSPAPGQFTVRVVNEDGSTGTIGVSGVSVSGAVVTLELASAIRQGQAVSLDYARDDAVLQRAGGGDPAPGFTGQAVAVSLPEPPGKPEYLAVSVEPGSRDVSADWDDVDGAQDYWVRWRWVDQGEKLNEGVRVTASETAITLDGYGDWVVRVQACNGAGCGKPRAQRFTVAAPAPTLTVADARGEEGGTVSFVVALSEASGETVTVDYATADGTATAGADYAAASGTLSFAAGETERTVAVQALADTAAEGDETLTLTLSNSSGAVIGDGQATGTVSNVAPPPTTVTGVAITSDAGDDHTYVLGDVIRVAVTFSEAVDVTGAPQIAIDMDPAEWGSKQASYASGSGTTTLTFTHTVAEPNISTQGIAVLANTLELNGGSIRSAAGVDAELSHAGLDHDAEHKVDWEG